MAFSKEVKLTGDKHTYAISPAIKRYALTDVGFIVTKAGNFALERSLSGSSPYEKGYKLKVTVAKDFSGFKLAITTANGLQSVNIFNDPSKSDNVTQYNFIMDNLVSRDILVRDDQGK
ncbi:DUF1831 domain-containing protein [Lentilactobacillus senioris]|uniref:DUF1831 domain-containing protein n=1 Tax=Lentilactobacillus senioris TaxID=931534 RepID=UPI003D28A25B